MEQFVIEIEEGTNRRLVYLKELRENDTLCHFRRPGVGRPVRGVRRFDGLLQEVSEIEIGPVRRV